MLRGVANSSLRPALACRAARDPGRYATAGAVVLLLLVVVLLLLPCVCLGLFST
jgi:hypothetical protein